MSANASDPESVLLRIAAALERLAPPVPAPADWLGAPAYVHDTAGTRAVAALEAPPLALLRGIDAQKAAVTANVDRLAAGHAAHDMLLWGARGMGKSALLRAAIRAAQGREPGTIALVQVAPDALEGLARMEIIVFLQEWLAGMPEFRLDPDKPVTMKGGNVGACVTLPLVWDI